MPGDPGYISTPVLPGPNNKDIPAVTEGLLTVVESDDATISGLDISEGTLVPGFSSDTTEYTVTVGNSVTSVTVTPTATDPGAEIRVNDVPVTGGSASEAIPLMVGMNTIKIEVTARDGITTKTYTITVTRAAGSGSGSGGGNTGGGSGSPGGNSGGSVPAPATPVYEAVLMTGTDEKETVRVTVHKDSGIAVAELDPGKIAGRSGVTITMPPIEGVINYTVETDAAGLAVPGGGTLTVNTDVCSIILPAGMLSGVDGTEGRKAQIIIGRGDKTKLPAGLRAAIGDRPLISLTLALDGEQVDWNNPDAPVTVSIPYEPTAAERANPESIVIWYIDGSGNVICVPNGRYDAATGTVTFTVTHFSLFAVSYNQVNFNDVPKDAWYYDAVSFIAAREITTGTGGGSFSPDAKLTRGQFIVMLMRAYSIASDENPDPKENFADAGNAYYTGFLAAAKRLGISNGVGNNKYAPEKEITRQEMFTLLYNALKVTGKLPTGNSGKKLSDFSDADEIASWAYDAMKLLVETGVIGGSGNKLSPKDTTTRAQMAQVLYNLLWK